VGASPRPAHGRDPRRLGAFVLLLLANAIWGAQFVLVKVAQEQLGPILVTALPMLLATVLLVPLVTLRSRDRAPSLGPTGAPRARGRRPVARDLVWFGLLGVLGQVAGQLGVTWGAARTTAANAALIQLALPPVTAVMAVVLLRERFTWLRGLAFALALGGVARSAGVEPSGIHLGGPHLAGNALVLLGVAGSAFYNVGSKHLLLRYRPLEVLLGSYVAVCLVLVPLALLLEPGSLARLGVVSLRGWMALAGLALLNYFLSMVVFLVALQRLDAGQAALSNYLIPFFGVVAAWLLLNERLGGHALAGGALALASTLVITLLEERLGLGRWRSNAVPRTDLTQPTSPTSPTSPTRLAQGEPS
jgi:O-acetylserine/cysteine efflux transporter